MTFWRRAFSPDAKEPCFNGKTYPPRHADTVVTVLEPLTSAMIAGLPGVSAHFSRFPVTEISLTARATGQFDFGSRCGSWAWTRTTSAVGDGCFAKWIE